MLDTYAGSRRDTFRHSSVAVRGASVAAVCRALRILSPTDYAATKAKWKEEDVAAFCAKNPQFLDEAYVTGLASKDRASLGRYDRRFLSVRALSYDDTFAGIDGRVALLLACAASHSAAGGSDRLGDLLVHAWSNGCPTYAAIIQLLYPYQNKRTR